MEYVASDILIGALIGIGRAVDGNEHLITNESDEVVIRCLQSAGKGEPVSSELMAQVDAVKRKMVPDCFFCASPCGRTDAYDLSRLEKLDKEERELKRTLIDKLCQIAGQENRHNTELLYRCLTALGIEEIDQDVLKVLCGETDALLEK